MLDNLNTHKQRSLAMPACPHVDFHFTPTYASWLNRWTGFRILTAGSAKGPAIPQDARGVTASPRRQAQEADNSIGPSTTSDSSTYSSRHTEELELRTSPDRHGDSQDTPSHGSVISPIGFQRATLDAAAQVPPYARG